MKMRMKTTKSIVGVLKITLGLAGRICTSSLVPLLLLLLTLPAVVQAQSYTDGYGTWYYTTNNGTITITGYTGPGGAVTIPDTINGLSVTSIGDYAFEDCTSLLSVTIPNGVTNIGLAAFLGCHSLTSVTIGNGVTSIGDYAFYECRSLTSLTIGTNVTSIGDEAFCWCYSLTSVTIPDSVTSIGHHAFYGCTSLTNVTIPNSVTSIGDAAFNCCSSLTAITVNTRNSVYSDLDGVLFNQSLTTLIQYPGGIAGAYTIPNSVTSIGAYAFTCCSSLTSVTLPNSVTNIEDYAFCQCRNLTSVTIPGSVTSIGAYAFSGCSSLANVTIGNGVTNIGDLAFESCFSLKNVTIGNGVTSIGDYAFAACWGLASVYFQGNAPSFGTNVFVGWGGENGGWSMDPATIYYLPGTTGWDAVSTNTGLPVVLWTPQVQTSDASFGVRTNQFGFTINWASGWTVVVEASTKLVNSVWSPVSTNSIVNGSSYFSDPRWSNYPVRFYRLRSP
jgi:BspA type Leucine rich repeat region (6 copies)